MKKRNQKQEKRLKKMILSTGLFAVLLVASTYAWFIGMQSVSVSAFDVKIKGIDGLALSLDGITFSENVNINKDTHDIATYATNQNVWGDLIPMSSVGVIDNTKSKLQMYEKGSLTATPGGYRILASEVENSADAEAAGYVAFDLFIKNLSGEEYYPTNLVANEEAIYLTTDSKVEVAANGGVNNTGIENSVRVAFAQIARVEATTTDESVIQGLNCSSEGDATVICNTRKAAIWEPNDTKHAANAINWYKKACKARTGVTVTDEKSYSGACAEVKDTVANTTYAISKAIETNFNVDIYDGVDYNGYAGSAEYLTAMDYFTDTEKMYKGDQRPQFMSLAPNSITKVKVYVYIEGQDVDNYDFAQLGNAISINFGFTKERFTGTDVNYDPNGTAPLPTAVQ